MPRGGSAAPQLCLSEIGLPHRRKNIASSGLAHLALLSAQRASSPAPKPPALELRASPAPLRSSKYLYLDRLNTSRCVVCTAFHYAGLSAPPNHTHLELPPLAPGSLGERKPFSSAASTWSIADGQPYLGQTVSKFGSAGDR
jgi:hypothetical protein